jgi:hypothetical protein
MESLVRAGASAVYQGLHVVHGPDSKTVTDDPL